MVREFIEGWDLVQVTSIIDLIFYFTCLSFLFSLLLLSVQVLGEGSFGEVKLLVSKENGEACAMKEVTTRIHWGFKF